MSSFLGLIPHVFVILNQYLKEVIMVYSGSEATKEAERTSAIVARLMNIEGADTVGFSCFLSQVRARNLNFQTVFYNINWKVLMAVGSTYVLCSVFNR